jgi:hypothetical protein
MSEKRGRPVGSKNKSTGFQHYNPKRWHPEFDLIVIESVSGKSNEEIGRAFGYTKEHVSNILSTPEAKKVKERIRESINDEFDLSLKERLANIGAKAIKHLENFMERDELAANDPFAFIDRAIKIGQVVGAVSKDSGNGNSTQIINGNALIINSTQAEELKSAMEKSMSLDAINPGDNIKLLKNGTDSIARTDR